MTLRGALAGVITGAVVVVAWNNLEGDLFDLYEILPGFLLSMLVIYIFSITDNPPSDTIRQKFDSIQ